MLAAYRRSAELGFTNPYFLDRELAAGFDIYDTYVDYTRESSYISDTIGTNLRMSYALQEKLQHGLYYTIHQNTIEDVPTTASAYIQEQQGTFLTSAVGQSLTYDERDNKFNPDQGLLYEPHGRNSRPRWRQTVISNMKPKLAFIILSPRNGYMNILGSGGYIWGINQKIRINDRFFIGGDDMRGFENAGVGPRDTSTIDALGGNAYYIGTEELHFPLGLPEELAISGAAFVDVGSLWHSDDTGANVFDRNAMRVSSGVGVLWYFAVWTHPYRLCPCFRQARAGSY